MGPGYADYKQSRQLQVPLGMMNAGVVAVQPEDTRKRHKYLIKGAKTKGLVLRILETWPQM